MTHSASYWVVIPAAGSGKRFLSSTPKQFLNIDDKSVLEHSLKHFLADPLNKGIIIAIEKDNPWFSDLALSKNPHVFVVEGGAERCLSVLNALWFIQSLPNHQNADIVLVHDAARPCLNINDLNCLLLEPIDENTAALLATPVTDTLKKSDAASYVEQTLVREQYWLAQTPQMAQLQTLIHSIEKMLDDGFMPTDEASALEHMGLRVKLVKASASNIKITQPGDIELARFILTSQNKN